MAPPSLADRIAHMLEAIDVIEAQVHEIDLDTFRNDRFRQLGIERCLEIISEASRHLPDNAKTAHLEIPWRRIADIGNRIRHAYHAVDAEIVWEIAVGELVELKAALEAMKLSNNDQ